MTQFNPNKFTLTDEQYDDIRLDDELTIEFYSNAREVVLNGTRYSMKAQGDGFVKGIRIR